MAHQRIAEHSEACRKHGLKLGLYYSQDLDWHEKDGGGEKKGKTWGGGTAYWTNNWDFPNPDEKDFSRYFEGKAKPQVKGTAHAVRRSLPHLV